MKTFVGGKEIKLYGKKELSQAFTNIVQSYLNSGFMIWMSGCSGSQGEEMKIDLSNDNGKTVYRVWMKDERLYGDDVEKKFHSYDVNAMKIFVKKYNIECKHQTLWMREGEEVECYTYYRIDDYKDVYVFDECDYADLIWIHNERQRGRWDLRKDWESISSVPSKVLLNIVRKQKGYKSVAAKDIQSVERRINKGYYKINIVNRSSLLLEIAK